jgi:hypothetical protein
MDTSKLVVVGTFFKKLSAAFKSCFRANVYFEPKDNDPYLRAICEEMKAEEEHHKGHNK